MHLRGQRLGIVRLRCYIFFHYAEMSSSFSVYDGIVGHNIVGHNLVDYMVTDGKKFNVTTHVQINYWNGDNSFDVDPWGNAAPANTNGLVMIGYASSPEDKRRVLSFDTRCMARMRGCNTVAESTTDCMAADGESRHQMPYSQS